MAHSLRKPSWPSTSSLLSADSLELEGGTSAVFPELGDPLSDSSFCLLNEGVFEEWWIPVRSFCAQEKRGKLQAAHRFMLFTSNDFTSLFYGLILSCAGRADFTCRILLLPVDEWTVSCVSGGLFSQTLCLWLICLQVWTKNAASKRQKLVFASQ